MREPIRFLSVLAILMGGLFGLKTLSVANGAADWWSAQAAVLEDEPAPETSAQDDEEASAEPASQTEPQQCEANTGSLAFANALSGGGRTAEEEALITRLAERRNELEARDDELDTREALIQAMEQRVDERIQSLTELQEQIDTLVGTLNEREAEDLNTIVAWYGAMEPADAAAVLTVLDAMRQVQIASAMPERRFGEILAQMDPPAAARLVELMATRSNMPQTAAELEARLGETR